MKNRNSLITLNDPKAPASEAYRMVRTNIEFSNIGAEKKAIVFTSARQKEGKSTTVVNTAIAIAQAGSKVLIIDCDLRKPRMHKLFRLPNVDGIVNCIVGNSFLNEIKHSIEEVKGLDVITSGPIPPMPSELLRSNSFRKIIKELKQEYDYILLDTPPVLSVTDSTILAAEADGTVLVVAHNDTPIDVAQMAKKALEKVKAKFLGVILTKAELKNRGYYYYNYDYGHDGGGKKVKNRKK